MVDVFFGSPEEDEELEEVNQVFWRSLLGHVRSEVPKDSVSEILDVGCHHGGLLELFASHFKPRRLVGIEPLERARHRARFRLARHASEVELRQPEEWETLSSEAFDLVLCHEVLHLVSDLAEFMRQTARVLKPNGHGYLVLGSHSENPLWKTWREQLVDLGHEVFDHSPLDILRAAAEVGLRGALRPLRRDGWVYYDPIESGFKYPTALSLFEHHYRHKLLFRLSKQRSS